jgi:hypothetical protein
MTTLQRYFLLLTTFLLIAIPADTVAQNNVDSLLSQVRANTQTQHDALERVIFTGHSKTYIYFDWSIFDVQLIPAYEEYMFEGYWLKPDSVRIVIKALRNTSSSDSAHIQARIHTDGNLPNPFGYSYNASVLGLDEENEDDSTRHEFPDIIYPFAAGADSAYDYRVAGTIGMNSEQEILDVAVTPKNSNTPAVVGSFLIDAQEEVVVGSDYLVNEAGGILKREFDADPDSKYVRYFLGDINENRHVIMRKALFYSKYWLPETVEEEFYIRILGMKAKVHRTLTFDFYGINIDLPDTTAVRDTVISYQIDPEMETQLIGELEHPERLTPEEEREILAKIGDTFSSMDLYEELFESAALGDEARNIALGLTLGQRGSKVMRYATKLSDNFQYNRVEGLRIDYGLRFTNPGLRNATFAVSGGFGIGDRRGKGEASVVWFPGQSRRWFFEGNAYHTTAFEEDNRLISKGRNTFTSLFLHDDYRDYYYKAGGSFNLGFLPTSNLALKLSWIAQEESNAQNHTSFSLFQWNEPFRWNPSIAEGTNNSVQGRLLLKKNSIQAGLEVEYSSRNRFSSDFNYTRAMADVMWNHRFDRRNQLHMFLFGGTSRGDLPPQRWFDFGGRTFMNYHGNLRGVNYKAFTGDRAAHGTVEYTRTGLGRRTGGSGGFMQILKLTLWTGAGWSKHNETGTTLCEISCVPLQTTNGWYREAGIGIGDRLNIFRVDCILNNRNDHRIQFGWNILR